MALQENVSPNTLMTPLTYAVDEQGQASVGGVPVLELAEKFGTPLYVLDEATIRAMAAAYRDVLKAEYPAESLPLFACKANCNMALVKLVEQEGMGLDVVSGGELYTAIQAGFPLEKVFFNGNNKTVEEVELAVHHRIGRITVDNFDELALIHKVAKSKGAKVPVLLRVAPGIECHTHDYIRTGQTDTKFGFDLAYLAQAVEMITAEYRDTIELKGLHAHIGSQIFEVRPYEDLVEKLLNIYYNIREHFGGLTLTDLNIGGGMGVTYTHEDDPPVVQDALRQVVAKIQGYTEQLGYPLPRLMLEPGRSMVATAGMTLYTVGTTKVVPNVRKYVAVDGGMGDNIRPALYQAVYSAVVVNKLNQPAEETVTIVGKYCESGDVLIKSLPVPRLEAGDTLAVFGTGAYNYTMASNYNRIPRPAVVLVENGNAHVIIQRETYQTLLQNDLLPDYLQEKREPVSVVRETLVPVESGSDA